MKIFNTDHKVNFVDENNVLVGFDNSGCCCETFGWFLERTPQTNVVTGLELDDLDLSTYRFDKEFFKEESPEDFECGGIAIFRLHGEGQELYLHLFNHHNGYYSHGFELKEGETTIRQAYL